MLGTNDVVIEPQQHVVITTLPGPFALRVTRDGDVLADTKVSLARDHTYVFNPGIAWSYSKRTYQYQIAAMAGMGGPVDEGMPEQPLFDAGMQPIGNRFLKQRDAAEEQFPLALEFCTRCGLVQTTNPVPASALVPRYDWITYNEPEPHLDGMVDRLLTRPGLGPGAVAGGVSFKDDSTLARLASRGLRTWRLDMAADLDVARPGLGVETIQEVLTPARARAAAARHGKANVLLVRHILEHTHDLGRFLESLRCLLAPGGYLVIEVPDCSRALASGDYTTIWEEHTFYYTPETFERCLLLNGFDIAGFSLAPPVVVGIKK
jgi:hypothetical protein